MATIGFTMIVKNEAHVVRRALESVRPLIDYALISDTGSGDGTPQIVRAWLAENGIKGEVIERPWVDFSHNRNETLDALNQVADVDYVLTIDADEYLVFEPGFVPQRFKDDLADADGWRVASRIDTHRFDRLQLFSNRLPFRFKYKIHEKIEPPLGATIGRAMGFFNQYTLDGARTRNKKKYLDDARVIEQELASGAYDDDPEMLERYTYYLAQCYKWGRRDEKARDIYLRHAQMEHSSRHAASSYLNIGQIMERLDDPPELTVATYLKAYDLEPSRSEGLCAAARVCNINGQYERAYELAKTASGMPEPDAWTVDTAVYEWRALDEFQIAAIGTGRFSEAVEASERLLSEAKFPESERARIEQNAAYALAQYELAPMIGPKAPEPASTN